MPGDKQTEKHEFEPLSKQVIGACIDVQRQLGLHCKEVDYQRALRIALGKLGLTFSREVEIPIAYDDVIVTKRRVDYLISDDTHEIMLETKAKSTIEAQDIEQCLLYLHQSGYEICLLVNFGERPLGIRRLIHTQDNQAPNPSNHAS